MSTIPERFAAVHQRIHQAAHSCGRDPQTIRLLAVSKRQPTNAIRIAAEGGQHDFGESYVQEALNKIRELADLALTWHFIGPIQSNKTKDIARHFTWAHSVDRLKIATRLSEQRPATLPPLNICLQVNIDNEASKSGFTPDAIAAAAKHIIQLPNLKLRGLMCIPQPREGFDAQRRPFRHMCELLNDLQQQGLALDTLSMGMSADLEAAIAEGATIVRIGTAVFGERI